MVSVSGTDTVPPISPRNKTWQQKHTCVSELPSHRTAKTNQMFKSAVTCASVCYVSSMGDKERTKIYFLIGSFGSF